MGKMVKKKQSEGVRNSALKKRCHTGPSVHKKANPDFN